MRACCSGVNVPSRRASSTAATSGVNVCSAMSRVAMICCASAGSIPLRTRLSYTSAMPVRIAVVAPCSAVVIPDFITSSYSARVGAVARRAAARAVVLRASFNARPSGVRISGYRVRSPCAASDSTPSPPAKRSMPLTTPDPASCKPRRGIEMGRSLILPPSAPARSKPVAARPNVSARPMFPAASAARAPAPSSLPAPAPTSDRLPTSSSTVSTMRPSRIALP